MNGQSLEAIIKSARDLMRKDAGLNTDVDRIPQLAWMLFLKCFDDFEKKRAALDKNYKEAIPAPYRWRDWAVDFSSFFMNSRDSIRKPPVPHAGSRTFSVFLRLGFIISTIKRITGRGV